MPTPDFFAESPESVGIDPAKLEALFERAAREVEDGNIGSCQIAIARDGKLAALRSYGSVTHEGRPAPATNETLYVVFSCTKAILSAAGWLLLKEGKLGLDERVAEIVPEFGTNGKDRVTVEQLFLHTAGFPNAPYPPSEWSSREKRLARFARWRLPFPPRGPRAPRAGGVGLPREHHGRLGDIEHRRAASTPEERRAAGWPEVIPETEVTEDAVQGFNRDFVREAGVPGGGACTSAGDLALFYQALLSGEALDGSTLWTPETLALARTVRSGDLTDPLFGVPVQRGLGIVVAGDDKRIWRGFGRTGSEHMLGHHRPRRHIPL